MNKKSKKTPYSAEEVSCSSEAPSSETLPTLSEAALQALLLRGVNCVYLLCCADGSLYCGWSNRLRQRIEAHQSGKGAKYTKSRLPVRLVYAESYEDATSARRREAAIKQLSRAQKLALIQGQLN